MKNESKINNKIKFSTKIIPFPKNQNLKKIINFNSKRNLNIFKKTQIIFKIIHKIQLKL